MSAIIAVLVAAPGAPASLAAAPEPSASVVGAPWDAWVRLDPWAPAVVDGTPATDDPLWIDGALRQPSPAFDAFVAQWLRATGTSSVAVGAIARGGRPVLARGYGLADRRHGVAATARSIYLLASASKPVVGLAAMKLVEVGRLDLEADVSAYLGYRLRDPWFPRVPITTRMLLAHVAGIIDASSQDPWRYPRPDPTGDLDAYIRRTLLPGGDDYRGGAYWDRRAGPATRYRYSNVGTTLAALVVENAAGVSFDRFCDAELFGPLGLVDTRWFHRQLAHPERLAQPYDAAFRSYGVYGFEEYPSGELRTTVLEWLRLWRVIAAGGSLDGVHLLDPASIAEFERVQYPRLDAYTGLLIESDRSGGQRELFKDGGEAGATTFFLYRHDGLMFVLLTNGESMSDAALERLIERTQTLAETGR
jgi:CubicO group peptidase (beta-lactamase class C family)